MLIFIDESGDSGIKFEHGSTRYFVIVALIFENNSEAIILENIVDKFKSNNGFIKGGELKFNKANKKLRLDFMKIISKYKFTIHCSIFDKTRMNNTDFNTKNSFYIYAISMLFKNSHDVVKNAIVKLDGSGDRIFRKTFIKNIKKYINTRNTKIISELKFSDSKSNLLIQMADMIAGSIRKACDGDTATKDIIKNHIKGECNFP